MEENVALDSSNQKKFVKSIKGIKKLLKKNGKEPNVMIPAAPKADVVKPKRKRFIREKGLVYLSHIPHGFYEHQMTQYFKQFGSVTNARVIRSKKTGNSKGFAFVEFAEPAVAQIVAETMNNYLMGKRLIKAQYIPPEKQRRAMRMHWSNNHNPGMDLQINLKRKYNADKSDEEELKRARKLLKNLSQTKKKLAEIGIDYDFFTPVDIPEEISQAKVSEEPENVDPPAKKSKATKTKVVEVPAEKKKITKEKKAKTNEVIKKVKVEPTVKKTKESEVPVKKEKTVEVVKIKKSNTAKVTSVKAPVVKKAKSIEKNEKVKRKEITVKSVLKRKK